MHNYAKKHRQELNPFVITGCVLAVLLVGAIAALILAPHTQGYASFIGRDPRFFEEIADACELLLQGTPPNSETEREVPGDDKSLPLPLRKLRANRISIGSSVRIGDRTNSYVVIRIGDSRGGYGLVWTLQDQQGTTWVLSANHESETRVLYKREGVGHR